MKNLLLLVLAVTIYSCSKPKDKMDYRISKQYPDESEYMIGSYVNDSTQDTLYISHSFYYQIFIIGITGQYKHLVLSPCNLTVDPGGESLASFVASCPNSEYPGIDIQGNLYFNLITHNLTFYVTIFTHEKSRREEYLLRKI